MASIKVSSITIVLLSKENLRYWYDGGGALARGRVRSRPDSISPPAGPFSQCQEQEIICTLIPWVSAVSLWFMDFVLMEADTNTNSLQIYQGGELTWALYPVLVITARFNATSHQVLMRVKMDSNRYNYCISSNFGPTTSIVGPYHPQMNDK